MLQVGIAGKEEAVVQNDGAVPVRHIQGEDMLIGGFQDQEAIALYGLMERHVRQGEDEGRAQAAALLEDGALQQTVSVQVLGDERLITGETVVVEEPETGLQGIFWIDADSHTWARGQYTCRLTLNCRSVMATAGAGSEL